MQCSIFREGNEVVSSEGSTYRPRIERDTKAMMSSSSQLRLRSNHISRFILDGPTMVIEFMVPGLGHQSRIPTESWATKTEYQPNLCPPKPNTDRILGHRKRIPTESLATKSE